MKVTISGEDLVIRKRLRRTNLANTEGEYTQLLSAATRKQCALATE